MLQTIHKLLGFGLILWYTQTMENGYKIMISIKLFFNFNFHIQVDELPFSAEYHTKIKLITITTQRGAPIPHILL
jgi:hypothetical protein